MENTETINIEEIMAQIRREIKEKGLTPDMLSFEDVPYERAHGTDGTSLAEAEEALRWLKAHYYVQPYKQLAGNPIKVFIKKVIRKLTKFYVEPVVFEQDDVNANVTNALSCIVAAQSGAEKDKPGESIADRLDVLELSNKELSARIERLEKENAQLREQLGKAGE